MVRHQCCQGTSDLFAHRPLLSFGVNLIAKRQHVRVRTETGGYVVQLFTGLKQIAQFQPPLGSFEIVSLSDWKVYVGELHGTRSALSRKNLFDGEFVYTP